MKAPLLIRSLVFVLKVSTVLDYVAVRRSVSRDSGNILSLLADSPKFGFHISIIKMSFHSDNATYLHRIKYTTCIDTNVPTNAY